MNEQITNRTSENGDNIVDLCGNEDVQSRRLKADSAVASAGESQNGSHQGRVIVVDLSGNENHELRVLGIETNDDN